MIKPIKLSKSSNALFQSSIEPDKIQLSQIIGILAAVLFAVSEITDIWAIPSASYTLSVFRWFVISTLLLTFYITTYYPKFFLKHYNKLKTFEFLLAGFLIEYSIYLSKSSELAYHIYFSGLLIVFMTLFSWTHLKLSYLIGITTVILLGYIFAVLARVDQGSHGAISLLIPTVSILFGSISVGFVGKILRDNHLHQRFLLQQSLKASYKEKEAEAEKYAYDANHDSLTDLPNRRYAEVYLAEQLEKAKLTKESIVVLFIDLNDFKQINDNYGHAAGDHILKVISKRLKFCINENDCLIRLGGDEFLITLMLENEERSLIHSIVNRIKFAIAEPIMFNGEKLQTSASVGLSTSSKYGHQITNLITAADKSMYEEKTLRKTKKKRLSNYSIPRGGMLSFDS